LVHVGQRGNPLAIVTCFANGVRVGSGGHWELAGILEVVAPNDNVWLPAGNDPAVIVKWIAQNVDNDAYNRRALLIPNKNHFTAQPAAVQHYAANGNVGTKKSHAAQRGGAVLAYETPAVPRVCQDTQIRPDSRWTVLTQNRR
jgi:hypothetical protein